MHRCITTPSFCGAPLIKGRVTLVDVHVEYHRLPHGKRYLGTRLLRVRGSWVGTDDHGGVHHGHTFDEVIYAFMSVHVNGLIDAWVWDQIA